MERKLLAKKIVTFSIIWTISLLDETCFTYVGSLIHISWVIGLLVALKVSIRKEKQQSNVELERGKRRSEDFI